MYNFKDKHYAPPVSGWVTRKINRSPEKACTIVPGSPGDSVKQLLPQQPDTSCLLVMDSADREL